MADAAEVLKVFDAREPDTKPYIAWEPLMEWVREHGADPDNVRRVEVLLLDAPLVRFYEFEVDEHGFHEYDPVTKGCKMREPYDVLCKRMPPERTEDG